MLFKGDKITKGDKGMKRFLFTLAIFLATLTASAVEPKAGLKGPVSATVGDTITLDLTACQGDGPPFLRVKGPDAAVKAEILYHQDGSPALARATVTVPGTYEFVLVTVGTTAPAPVPTPGPTPTPAKETAPAPGIAVDTWSVSVGTQPPPTPPTPGPGPGPVPVPVPIPAIIPAATQLYAVAVYSADTTNPDEVTFAAVRDDPTLAASLKALNVDWRAWDTANPVIDRLSIRPCLAAFGKTPALLIYDALGNVYTATGLPSTVTTTAGVSAKSAIPAPLKSADVVALFKKLRGVN